MRSGRSAATRGGLLLFALMTIGSPAATSAAVRDLEFTLPDGRSVVYALSIPDGAGDALRPLVLALHPGGDRRPHYGSWFAREIVLPATTQLRAVVVAPDCPTERWTDAGAEQAVMLLLEKVIREQKVDRRRILVVGFSMGGRGAWHFASRHPDVFTAAIPMAAPAGDEPIETLATIPTYVIHSRGDTVVPFAPAERNARALKQLGRPIRFESLADLPHFSMGGYVPSLQRAVGWVSERWRAAGASR